MASGKFEEFLKHRQTLIYQYKKGDLSKKEFIQENYDYITKLNIKPFKKIDNYKKAIYNYQYYNVLAKYYQRRASEISKNHYGKKDFIELVNYYYSKKDHVTLKLLKLLDFSDVEAYFVKVNSPKLKKKLFEIVIKHPDVLLEVNSFLYTHNSDDQNYIILHSKNEVILNFLKHENVFSDDVKKSIVDSYINQKY